MEAEAREQKRRLVLKFGDVITLNCLEFQGCASANDKQTPQVDSSASALSVFGVFREHLCCVGLPSL